jgi:2-hydroxychromene-2-carboxylate isomerase
VLREVAKAAGLDEEAAAEAAWDLDRISAMRSVREEALGIGVHGVPTIATKEEVLYLRRGVAEEDPRSARQPVRRRSPGR